MDYISNHDLLLKNLLYLSVIVQAIAVFLGVVIMLTLLLKLKKIAESRSHMSQAPNMMGPLMMFLSSAVLLAIPTFLSITLNTIWGTDSPMAYNTGNSGVDQMMEPVLAFVRLLGVISFIRGFLMLSRHNGEQGQPGHLSKSFMHILGGIFCMHVVGSSYLVLNLMGCFS
ncbi:MAG: hypothetical protein A3F17_04220 [Gammaproteobacteria bacterium RIFCSPHIGHO2_12_FULL_41_15]|nr:MAG: hypothetical protein A3F17_04220 [Gammaproteobacteria bacterium RIFCSPHIGHO2_12_FULL_41_15]